MIMIYSHDYQQKYRLVAHVIGLAALFGLVSATSSYGLSPLRIPEPVIDQIATVVGMSVGVAPNEYNQLAQALTDKEKELSERESAITERELSMRTAIAEDLRRENMRTLLLVGGVLIVLFLMIGMNYYFDIRRSIIPAPLNIRGGHPGELQTRI